MVFAVDRFFFARCSNSCVCVAQVCLPLRFRLPPSSPHASAQRASKSTHAKRNPDKPEKQVATTRDRRDACGVLPPKGTVKYLEQQMITFVDHETTEVQHRIRCAWSEFAKHRQELTSQSHLLRHRLQVVDAVVTPIITYGAGTWATSSQRRML